MKKAIIDLKKHTSPKIANKYNFIIIGIQNYYKIATLVNIDLNKIEYKLSKKLYNRTKNISNKNGLKTNLYLNKFKNNNRKEIFVAGKILYSLGVIKYKSPLLFNQKINNYTKAGRELIHGKLAYINPRIMKYLMINPAPYKSTLFNDNRLSLYAAQQGLCGISGQLLKVGDMEVHHIKPTKETNGQPDDRYKNLLYITNKMHKLIHFKYKCLKKDEKYYICISEHNGQIKEIKDLNIEVELVNPKMLERLNKYRKLVGNESIIVKGI